MNWFPIIITIILTSSTTITTATAASADEQPDDALFQWPSFTNNHHGSASILKKVQCTTSIHNVYACLRSSLVKFPVGHQHNLLHGATDCCTTIADFRSRCGGFAVRKLESFIFPAMLFKQCAAGDPPAPASAPDAAAGSAADIEV